ncbi:MAG: HD-GYP domain-containing protein [Cellulosilyticaceae bacterium]
MKEVKTLLSECKEGDVVARDIIDTDRGVTLCSKGHVLTKELIHWVGKFKHTDIYIAKYADEKVWQVDPKTRATYEENKETIKGMLEGIRENKPIEPSHIKEITNNFYKELKKNNDIIGCISRVKSIDEYTYYHSMNVGMLSVVIGKWLKMSKAECDALFLAGILHDVGKYEIDSKILNKKGKLTTEEFEEAKKHVIYSYKSIKGLEDVNYSILEGVFTHHERIDGSGYPRGLKQDKIHIFGRILAIADTYDAMTSERPYKKRSTPFTVMEEMYDEGFDKLDPQILFVFLNNIASYYLGVEVMLSNGATGEVVFIHPECVYRPIVKVGGEYIDLYETKSVKIAQIVE